MHYFWNILDLKGVHMIYLSKEFWTFSDKFASKKIVQTSPNPSRRTQWLTAAVEKFETPSRPQYSCILQKFKANFQHAFIESCFILLSMA